MSLQEAAHENDNLRESIRGLRLSQLLSLFDQAQNIYGGRQVKRHAQERIPRSDKLAAVAY